MNIQKQILHLDLRTFLGGFWRENSNETCVTNFQTMWFPNVSKCTKMYLSIPKCIKMYKFYKIQFTRGCVIECVIMLRWLQQEILEQEDAAASGNKKP